MDPRKFLPADPFDALVTLDFETYYDDEYGLRALTTEGYVRDARFEPVGCGVAVGDAPAVWLRPDDFTAWTRSVDWARTAVLAHHAHFDGLILSHHYGVKPAFWFDTLSMARALHGTEVGGSLEALGVRYGVGAKGHEVAEAIGLHAPWAAALGKSMTWDFWRRYGRYCCNDVELTRGVLHKMLANGYPELELWAISEMTIKPFTEPFFQVDRPLLEEYAAYEATRKADLYARVAQDKCTFTSGDKFAALLRSFGVEPERKPSPTHECGPKCKPGEDGECPKLTTWAFSSKDPFMQGLLEHHDEEIRWLAEARIAAKSTINETRTRRLLDSASRGPVPVYLKYSGAHTHRWSGGDKLNFQNFERA